MIENSIKLASLSIKLNNKLNDKREFQLECMKKIPQKVSSPLRETELFLFHSVMKRLHCVSYFLPHFFLA
jgi:hypothetical protein